jgi:hypothetical protein
MDGETVSPKSAFDIGLSNTLADLLSAIHERTGFAHFRVFWRGAPLVVDEDELYQPLEYCNICNGMFIVKNEPLDVPFESERAVAPGASALEVEILLNFPIYESFLDLPDGLAFKVRLLNVVGLESWVGVSDIL